jgi:hypothetical protein
MKRKTLLPLVVLIVLSLVFLVQQSQAQTNEDVTWQFLVPQSVSGADDLKALLTQEVREIIAAGHLAPFGVIYGEGPRHFYWYQRFDVVYALSLAYPYLPADVQAQVKTYLKSEMQQYPLWSGDLLSSTVGTRREPDQITDAERGAIPGVYANRPQLFSLYALWLYAQQTGDWAYIQQNWSAIVAFYNGHRSETNRFYQSIAGAIGMARMARQKPTPDTQMQNTALADATAGLNAGMNYSQFGQNATNAYIWNENGVAWTLGYIYQGFQLLNLTPEVARFINANSALKSAVLGSSRSDTYAVQRAEYLFPLWYMAQSSAYSTYFGEGSNQSPDVKAMLFPIKAWVQKQPAATLRTYVDVPDALLGDFYYLQGLVYTIQAHGQECWEDIRTTGVECAGSAVPTVPPVTLTSSPTPSVTPVPPTFTHTPSPTFTATPTLPPTSTPVPPTATLPPTSTPVPPTATLPPTSTPVPPTATLPPTSTPVPPTATLPPISGNARIEVQMVPAAAGMADVNVSLLNVANLYGIQTACTVDPSVLAGVSYTGSDGFNEANSFLVDKGFDPATGTWVVGVTRVRPAEPINGSVLAFKMSYSVLQTVTNPTFNCSVQAVDVNGADVPVEIVIIGYDGQLTIIVPPTVTPPEPTLVPTASVEPPTPVPNGLSIISGVAHYPGRADHAGIKVSLYSLDALLAEVTTLSNGVYQFTDVPVGVYFVHVDAPQSLRLEYQVVVEAGGLVIDLGTDLLSMGDTDSNGLVDLADASFIGANYGVDAALAPNGDLTQDSVIDINDLVLVGNSFGLIAPIIETVP